MGLRRIHRRVFALLALAVCGLPGAAAIAEEPGALRSFDAVLVATAHDADVQNSEVRRVHVGPSGQSSTAIGVVGHAPGAVVRGDARDGAAWIVADERPCGGARLGRGALRASGAGRGRAACSGASGTRGARSRAASGVVYVERGRIGAPPTADEIKRACCASTRSRSTPSNRADDGVARSTASDALRAAPRRRARRRALRLPRRAERRRSLLAIDEATGALARREHADALRPRLLHRRRRAARWSCPTATRTDHAPGWSSASISRPARALAGVPPRTTTRRAAARAPGRRCRLQRGRTQRLGVERPPAGVARAARRRLRRAGAREPRRRRVHRAGARRRAAGMTIASARRATWARGASSALWDTTSASRWPSVTHSAVARCPMRRLVVHGAPRAPGALARARRARLLPELHARGDGGRPELRRRSRPRAPTPTIADWQHIFANVAPGEASWGSDGPTIGTIGAGCGKPNPMTQRPGAFSRATCSYAIAMVESGWRQFCVPDTPAASVGAPSRTIVSFDCGYGIGQVTSGMHVGETPDLRSRARRRRRRPTTSPPARSSSPAKWTATNCVGDNDPDLVEDWYTAIWAYNGLAYSNNPNNPNLTAGSRRLQPGERRQLRVPGEGVRLDGAPAGGRTLGGARARLPGPRGDRQQRARRRPERADVRVTHRLQRARDRRTCRSVPARTAGDRSEPAGRRRRRETADAGGNATADGAGGRRTAECAAGRRCRAVRARPTASGSGRPRLAAGASAVNRATSSPPCPTVRPHRPELLAPAGDRACARGGRGRGRGRRVLRPPGLQRARARRELRRGRARRDDALAPRARRAAAT